MSVWESIKKRALLAVLKQIGETITGKNNYLSRLHYQEKIKVMEGQYIC